MSKYSKKTKEAVEKVASLINIPVNKKRLSLIFGSGINANLTHSSLSWSELAQKSVFDHLKSSKKKFTSFEAESISKMIVGNLNNNKMAASFSKTMSLSGIKPLPSEEIEWFTTGYLKMKRKLDNNLEILTLNYDIILDNVFQLRPVNYLIDEPREPGREILHLHGLVNNKGEIQSPSLFSLLDYVNYSERAELKLLKFLRKEDEIESETFETVLIIGSSLQEEHILRALKKYKGKDEKLINILLITHQVTDKTFFEKFKKIYAELKINVVNINSGKSIEEDFRSFWTFLSESIEGKTKIDPSLGLSLRDDVMDNELYFILKNTLEGRKNLTLSDMNEEVGEVFDKPYMIRPIYWLETSDKILESGSLKMFMFETLPEVPLHSLHFLKFERFTKAEIKIIFNQIDNNLDGENSFGYNSDEYEVNTFIEEHIVNLNSEELRAYKNLSKYILKKCISKHERLADPVSDYALKAFSYRDITEFDLYISYSTVNPSKKDFIFKLMEKDLFENRNPFDQELPESKDSLFTFLNNFSRREITRKIIYLFLVDKYNEMVYKYFRDLLEYVKSGFSEDDSFKGYGIYSLVYLVMAKRGKAELFINEVKGIKGFPFEHIPSRLEVFGFSSSSDKPISPFDGQLISDPVVLNSFSDVQRIFDTNEHVKHADKTAIINFLRNKWSIPTLKFIVESKKMADWGHFEKLGLISVQAKTWKEYISYMQIIYTGNTIYDFDFLDINPPFDRYKRVADISKLVEDKYDPKILSEINDIVKLNIIFGQYKDKYSMWWNKELRLLNKYKDKNKKLRKTIDEILYKTLNWGVGYTDKFEDDSYVPKYFMELDYMFRFNKDFKSPDLQLVLKLVKEDNSNELKTSHLRIIDYAIRSKKDRKIWNKEIEEFFQFKDKYYKGNVVSGTMASLKRVFIYNAIEKQSPGNMKSIGVTILDVVHTLEWITNQKRVDSKIASILRESMAIPEAHRDPFWVFRLLDCSKIGPKTTKYFEEYMSKMIGSVREGSYLYSKDDIMGFLNHISEDKKKTFLQAFRNRGIDLY